jgi:hypothetical protein
MVDLELSKENMAAFENVCLQTILKVPKKRSIFEQVYFILYIYLLTGFSNQVVVSGHLREIFEGPITISSSSLA